MLARLKRLFGRRAPSLYDAQTFAERAAFADDFRSGANSYFMAYPR